MSGEENKKLELTFVTKTGITQVETPKMQMAFGLYIDGYSKSELARVIGVDRKTVTRWARDFNWEVRKREALVATNQQFFAAIGVAPAVVARRYITTCVNTMNVASKEMDEAGRKGLTNDIAKWQRVQDNAYNGFIKACQDVGVDPKMALNLM